MDKSPEAFRTISEVAEWLDVPTHVLRFWESRFTQVKPVKRAGGRRYYRPSDMALLGGIKKLLHEDGLTIRGVQKVLREQGVKHVANLVPGPGNDPGTDAAGSADVAPVIEDAQLSFDSVDMGATPDPDAALHRFPFVDEPVEDAASEPPADSAADTDASGPDTEAETETASEGDPVTEDAPVLAPEAAAPSAVLAPGKADAAPGPPSEPAAAAFIADVPDTDPEDDDPSIVIPGALPLLGLPGRAEHLATQTEALRALHDRACALRDRIAARTELQ